MTEQNKLTALGALDEQGRRLGYDKKPEVQDYPVLGCLGALNPQQLETMAYHLDHMPADERERVTKALMDFGTEESEAVGGTLAGMGLAREPSVFFRLRYPYLSQHAFRGGLPRYHER